MKNIVYVVTYVDYIGKKHLYFCQDDNEVQHLIDNYKVIEVSPYNSDAKKAVYAYCS